MPRKHLLIVLLCAFVRANADTQITTSDGTQTTVNGDMISLMILPKPSPSKPAPAPTSKPSVTVSNDGTTIPGATQIVDASKNIWTVTGGVVNENGKPAGFSANVTLLLYKGNAIFQQNNAGNWWYWTGSGWQASSDPRIPTPNAQKGTWQWANLGGMPYAYLMPDSYNPTTAYPVMLFLHQLANSSAEPGQVDPWFNTPAFRSQFPAIILVPLCANSSASLNWGGVDTASQTCGDQAFAILQQTTVKYVTDPTRIYVTGNSMGGIGSWDMIIRHNDTFAAALILAGATYDHDAASAIQLLMNFPIWAIHGAQDTQVPLAWDRQMAASLKNMKYDEVAGDGHDVWDDPVYGYANLAHFQWLFAQKKVAQPPAPAPSASPSESASGTTIPQAANIIDHAGNVWTVVNGVIQMNGQNAGFSANVTTLLYFNGTIYQSNGAGWWSWTGSTWATASDPRVVPTSGNFHVSNGQIIGLNGQPVTPVGICVMYNTGGGNPTPAQVQNLFPGANYLRLAMYNYVNDSNLQSYVTSFTNAGFIVNIEDHQSSDGQNRGGGTGNIFTGSQLSAELAWYQSLGATFLANPRVWFSTTNEPSEIDANGNNNPAALSDWQLSIYNAIRNSGNNNPVMLETTAWSSTQVNVNYKSSDYAQMKNVIWDHHVYPWLFNGATDANTIASMINGMVSAAGAITSADGTIPVFFGEFGDSTTGSSPDANGTQSVQGVLTSGRGFAAWMWAAGAYDCLLGDNAGTTLSSYGQQVAAGIRALMPAAKPKPLIGVIPLDQPNNPADAAAFAKWLGKPVSVVLDYTDQSSWSNLVSAVQWDAPSYHGSKYKVVWSVALTTQAGTSLADVAKGSNDSDFEEVAKAVAANTPGAIIRLGWEFNNGNWDPWDVGVGGTSADYIRAFRHVAAIFRKTSSAFKFDWCPSWSLPTSTLPDSAYPGDDVVDYIGMDVYDQTGNAANDFSSGVINAPYGLAWHAKFAQQHKKPLSYPEWGAGAHGDVYPGHAQLDHGP